MFMSPLYNYINSLKSTIQLTAINDNIKGSKNISYIFVTRWNIYTDVVIVCIINELQVPF